VVAAHTNEIIIINNMLAVNIRKPPLPYVLYKKAMFGLVYPVTPCYRAHPPDQNQGLSHRTRTLVQTGGSEENATELLRKNTRSPEEQMAK